MRNLINKIQELRQSEIKPLVDSRIKEFEGLGRKDNDALFKELCFCILTANFNAERGIKIQNELGNGFLNLSEIELAEKLKGLGHRFPNARAKYITEARSIKNRLKEILSKGEESAREFLAENIKGIGYKEASHFLRNIGFKNLAIIDFHILDVLEEHKIIEKPKCLSKSKYIEIENKLSELAQKLNMNLAELDLYLWYNETGKVLK
jgi:N-glycosylase/DNA lyase